jgi:hypothetical protein
MNVIVSGRLIDAVTHQSVTSAELSLTRHGILGEARTHVNEDGKFVFNSTSGQHCLGIHDDHYAPLYLTLEEEQPADDLQIPLIRAAFLKGRILDEEGRTPYRCHFTLIREGTRRGQSGYLSDSGDHQVARDGVFSSPPLHPGRYFLRFAGILQKATTSIDVQSTRAITQDRIFDFVYPDVQEISEAMSFDLQPGQTISNLEVRISQPVWYNIRGRLTGDLPEPLSGVYVLFGHNVGMLDDFGFLGHPVNQDGTFEGHAQPGRLKLFVNRLTSTPAGYKHAKEQFANVEVRVGDCDVENLEIHI